MKNYITNIGYFPKLVDKFDDKEYSAISANTWIMLCDKQDVAFLVLRSVNDLENLKKFLDGLKIYKFDE